MFEDMFRKFQTPLSAHSTGRSWRPVGPCQDPQLQVIWSTRHGHTMGFAPWEQLETPIFWRTAVPMAGPVPKEMPHPEKCPQQPAWHGRHKTFPTKDGSNVYDSVESPAEWKKIKPYQATHTSPVHLRVSTEVWDFFSTLEASLRTWTVKAKPMNRTNCIEANRGKSSGIRAKDGCQYCWDHWLKRASRLTQILHKSLVTINRQSHPCHSSASTFQSQTINLSHAIAIIDPIRPHPFRCGRPLRRFHGRRSRAVVQQRQLAEGIACGALLAAIKSLKAVTYGANICIWRYMEIYGDISIKSYQILSNLSNPI